MYKTNKTLSDLTSIIRAEKFVGVTGTIDFDQTDGARVGYASLFASFGQTNGNIFVAVTLILLTGNDLRRLEKALG